MVKHRGDLIIFAVTRVVIHNSARGLAEFDLGRFCFQPGHNNADLVIGLGIDVNARTGEHDGSGFRVSHALGASAALAGLFGVFRLITVGGIEISVLAAVNTAADFKEHIVGRQHVHPQPRQRSTIDLAQRVDAVITVPGAFAGGMIGHGGAVIANSPEFQFFISFISAADLVAAEAVKQRYGSKGMTVFTVSGFAPVGRVQRHRHVIVQNIADLVNGHRGIVKFAHQHLGSVRVRLVIDAGAKAVGIDRLSGNSIVRGQQAADGHHQLAARMTCGNVVSCVVKALDLDLLDLLGVAVLLGSDGYGISLSSLAVLVNGHSSGLIPGVGAVGGGAGHGLDSDVVGFPLRRGRQQEIIADNVPHHGGLVQRHSGGRRTDILGDGGEHIVQAGCITGYQIVLVRIAVEILGDFIASTKLILPTIPNTSRVVEAFLDSNVFRFFKVAG